MSFSGDDVNAMTIQSGRNSCIQVSVVDGNDVLVVVFKKGAQATKNTAAIEECVRALRHGTKSSRFLDALVVLILSIIFFVLCLPCVLLPNLTVALCSVRISTHIATKFSVIEIGSGL